MEKIPIKFRGVAIENYAGAKIGETVYGGCNQFQVRGNTVYEIVLWNGAGVEVEPESVAQLVGYDKNNDEVYDNDEVIVCGVCRSKSKKQ